MNLSRRYFLKWGMGTFIAGCLPLPALAATQNILESPRRIPLLNTHTAESIDICYYKKGIYCADALEQINHILRDHRTSEMRPIDLRLLDLLYAVKVKIGPQTPFHVISGYRSPSTNEMLRKTTNGVARTSYHTKGMAIDIRLPGCGTRRLRDVCIGMQSGGVGYYSDSNFVHLDTGPFRTW